MNVWLEPRMMKFDDKEGLSEEFDCYQLIQKYIPRSELLVPHEAVALVTRAVSCLLLKGSSRISTRSRLKLKQTASYDYPLRTAAKWALS